VLDDISLENLSKAVSSGQYNHVIAPYDKEKGELWNSLSLFISETVLQRFSFLSISYFVVCQFILPFIRCGIPLGQKIVAGSSYDDAQGLSEYDDEGDLSATTARLHRNKMRRINTNQDKQSETGSETTQTTDEKSLRMVPFFPDLGRVPTWTPLAPSIEKLGKMTPQEVCKELFYLTKYFLLVCFCFKKNPFTFSL